MASNLLVVNGAVIAAGGDAPSAAAFLASTPGAYTTTRTHAGATTVLFWAHHLCRLSDSVRILSETRPDLMGSCKLRLDEPFPAFEPSLLDSLRAALQPALANRTRLGSDAAELAVMALVRAREEEEVVKVEVGVHLGYYTPPVFGVSGVHLAVAGGGREVATAKYAQWAR